MKTHRNLARLHGRRGGRSLRRGRVRYGLAAWLLGLPLPFIIIALIWGGCRW